HRLRRDHRAASRPAAGWPGSSRGAAGQRPAGCYAGASGRRRGARAGAPGGAAAGYRDRPPRRPALPASGPALGGLDIAAMLEAKGVWVEAGGHVLLADIDLAVAPGRLTVMIGPNGAGKSTLLRVLSGEIAPTRGKAALDGVPLSSFSAAELARRRAVV